MTIHCPHCQAKIRTSQRQFGKANINCPNCERTIAEKGDIGFRFIALAIIMPMLYPTVCLYYFGVELGLRRIVSYGCAGIVYLLIFSVLYDVALRIYVKYKK